MSAGKPFGLMNFRQENMGLRAPVAILNEASTQHERIAYCWAIVTNARDIAKLMSPNDGEAGTLADIFLTELEPVCALLERMAAESAGKEAAQ